MQELQKYINGDKKCFYSMIKTQIKSTKTSIKIELMEEYWKIQW